MKTEYLPITKQELRELIEEIVEQKLPEWIDESKIREIVYNRLLKWNPFLKKSAVGWGEERTST